jgi:hypothetical protein
VIDSDQRIIWRTSSYVPTLRAMTPPSIFILFWCGFAATIAAAFAGAVLAPRTPAAWAILPRPDGARRSAVASLLAGLVVYPVLYGIVFEAFQRADIRIGFLFGVVHAVAAFLLARASLSDRGALRIAGMHLVYVVTLALLYVTP